MDDAQHKTTAPPVMTKEDLGRLINEANAGDEAARARLREWLDTMPAETWQAVGDPSNGLHGALRGAICGQNYLEAEFLRRCDAALRTSLLTEDATVIEQLLVEQLITCRLHSQLADVRLAEASGGTAPSTYWIRFAESAERRMTKVLSEWQSLQKLLGRPACRAAIAAIRSRVPPTPATAGAADAPPKQAAEPAAPTAEGTTARTDPTPPPDYPPAIPIGQPISDDRPDQSSVGKKDFRRTFDPEYRKRAAREAAKLRTKPPQPSAGQSSTPTG